MTLAHFLKEDCSNVIKEDSLSLMGHCALWEFVIFAHFLIFTHKFQPAFVVISDLKDIGLISCRINQTVDSVSHSLIFQGHCVALEKSGHA